MNLLTDPVFSVETADGLRQFNLPALLTALGTDQVESLPGLQRHQEDAIYIFLCQLAASVLVHEKKTDPNQNEKFWCDAIRRLTGRDDDCAWTLVVEDVNKPAFMQPSIPGNSIDRLRLVACTPDEMDILPTAKNHDIKTARSSSDSPEEWVFALISLQTTAGFFGRGNYGIARMNGFAPNALEIAPRYSGVLAGITNTAATIPGIVGVIVTGWLVDVTGTYVSAFVLAAGLCVFGAVIWLMYAKVQPVVT